MKFNGISFVLIIIGSFLASAPDGLAAAGPYADPTAVTIRADESLAQAEALLQRARQEGLDYLNSKDDRSKKAAKKDLEDAEKLIKKLQKDDQNCEKCAVLLTNAYFYQAYFGFSKNYEECLKSAAEGLGKYPSNGKLAYFKGFAEYNSGKYSDSIKTFNRFLMTPADEQTTAQVKQILKDSQARFLASWNKSATYYDSPDSKILAYNPQTFRQEPVFQVTRDWEMQLGGLGFQQLTSQASTIQDPELKSYLDGLVSRLLSKSPGSPFDYQLTIVNSPQVNAVTPPGHIVIYTGLLAFAENESELAGVLAHELAHNYAHHQARAVLQKYKIQSVANAIVQAINPQSAGTQIAAALGSMITVELFSRAYSRSEEKEADVYGSHILFNAGYNPTALSGFFLKMYKANPKQPLKFLSTHPPVPDRAIYLTDYLESFPLETEMQLDSKEFQKMKARLATLVPSTNQPAGGGRGVLPNQ